jgi:hypothetical protein
MSIKPICWKVPRIPIQMTSGYCANPFGKNMCECDVIIMCIIVADDIISTWSGFIQKLLK